jgi:uncharacterized membrane protein YraQ (UPF0718 family)
MAKTHTSLSPATNIVLTIVWGAIAAYLVFVFDPHVPLIIAVVGAMLGAVGGVMQHLSFKEATNGFTNSSSLLDVRRAFKATSWGSRYISWLYFSKFVLAVLAFLVIRQSLLEIILGYLAGYMSLMFAREVVTLRDTFYLKRLTSQDDSSSTNVG